MMKIETKDWRGYCRVTFTQKPSRETAVALAAAGYMWEAGRWIGKRAKLPAGVLAWGLSEGGGVSEEE